MLEFLHEGNSRKILAVLGKDFAVNILLRKVIIPTMLTFTYFVFIGPFSIFAKIFSRKMLNQKTLADQTFWIPIDSKDTDPAKLLRQS